MSIAAVNTLSIRTDPENPDHHLFNNNGTWWIHYTIHLVDYTKRRIRASLGTPRLAEARERRDAVLAHLRFHAQSSTLRGFPAAMGRAA